MVDTQYFLFQLTILCLKKSWRFGYYMVAFIRAYTTTCKGCLVYLPWATAKQKHHLASSNTCLIQDKEEQITWLCILYVQVILYHLALFIDAESATVDRYVAKKSFLSSYYEAQLLTSARNRKVFCYISPKVCCLSVNMALTNSYTSYSVPPDIDTSLIPKILTITYS